MTAADRARVRAVIDAKARVEIHASGVICAHASCLRKPCPDQKVCALHGGVGSGRQHDRVKRDKAPDPWAGVLAGFTK